MRGKYLLFLLILSSLLITACGQNTASGQIDYEETKKMVVDILKTDDGKKAIQEVMSDEKLRQELIMDQAIVTETIQNTLASEKGADFWRKSFEDPKFAESMAKTMEKENEQLMKKLMDDPEYRSKMIELLKDPELAKEMTDLLKSNEYREHVKEVVSETIESPLYQTKIQDLLLKAAEKTKKKEKKADEA